MSTRYTRQESQVVTRQRLVGAAAAVFGRRGYRAATVAEIAEEAGFTIGAVYSNFSGKEDLFLAVVDEHLGSQLEDAAAILHSAPSLEEAAVELGRRAMSYLQEHPDWFPLFVEAWAYAIRDTGFRPRFTERQATSHARLTQVLQQRLGEVGLPTGEMAIANAALAVKALYHGVALELATNPASVPADALASAFTFLLRGLTISAGPPPGAPAKRRSARGSSR